MAEIKKSTLRKVVKAFNVISALVLIGLSALSLVFIIINAITSLKFFLIFSPLFMIAFGVFMIAAQLKIKSVLRKVPFLKSLLGRGLFNIQYINIQLGLSSTIYFYFQIIGSELLAWISATVMFVSGVVYLCMHFGCAKKLQQNNVLEDDEDQQPYKQPLA